jgi:hypothetical protein
MHCDLDPLGKAYIPLTPSPSLLDNPTEETGSSRTGYRPPATYHEPGRFPTKGNPGLDHAATRPYCTMLVDQVEARWLRQINLRTDGVVTTKFGVERSNEYSGALSSVEAANHLRQCGGLRVLSTAVERATV